MGDQMDLQESTESEKNNSKEPRGYAAVGIIWDIATLLHPHRDEIFCVVKVLNGIGVGPKIIGASLSFQKWKTFFGSTDWAAKDVHHVLEYLAHKDKQIQVPSFTTELHK
jgi:hypothetical protein